MKKYITALTLCLAAIVTGCKDDYELNVNMEPVERLTAPVNDKFTKLQPATSAALSFEWDQARAQDGSLVLYEVVFDKTDGDFSNPIGKMASDGGGIQNKLTLSHKDLNSLAGKAGIAALGTGKIKWTVNASKGFNIQQAKETRTIEVERPNGFAEIPVDVFLTGDATEVGATLGSALKMKATTAGVFEVYTRLKDGKYRFADRNTGTPNYFSMDAGLLKEGGENTQTGTKVYRIRLDFNNATATATELGTIGLWFAPDNKFLFEIPYVGNGTWSITNQVITFRQESWGRDERYKLRMNVVNNGTPGEEWWGSANADNQRPTDATALSFWELRSVSNDRWQNSFKFKAAVDTKPNDVNVYFKADKNYTHEIIVK
ncbi:SusE domain-containing protein [Chitinophaga horti]|uniref:SusE domain-containing protein n=1 Tax=Chitinophaga horti TaxID=2920382 RepID=A0ABY6IZ73_9BACT|nr:SusE domain-containing protein [Chitinophaga horti]UYQ91702.1 SusE domain-containing protein [Chitinophaga horti]